MSEHPFEQLIGSLASERAVTRRGFVAGIGLAALAACGGSATAKPSPGAPYAIGIIHAMTGTLVNRDKAYQIPVDLAINEINAAGGVLGRKWVLKEYDDQGQAAAQAQAARNLVSDGVGAAIGPTGSSLALASFQVTQQNKVFQSPLASDPTTNDPAKYPGVFLTKESSLQDNQAIVGYMADTLKIKKFALLLENTAFGQSYTPIATKMLADRNLKPVYQNVFEQNSASFETQVTAMKAAGAEAIIFAAASVNDDVKLVTTLYSHDFNPIIGTGNAIVLQMATILPSSVKLPKEYLLNITVPAYKSLCWQPGKPLDARRKAYAQKLAATPGIDAGGKYTVLQNPFYDFLYMLKHSVESAKSYDFDKVKKEFENIKNYDGILGKISFSSSSHLGIQDADVGLGAANDYTAPESLGFLPQLKTA